MKPRDIYWYRRRRVARILFWAALAVGFYLAMSALTPASCATHFTEICT